MNSGEKISKTVSGKTKWLQIKTNSKLSYVANSSKGTNMSLIGTMEKFETTFI